MSPGRADWRARGAAFASLYLVLAPFALLVVAHRLIARRRALVGLHEKCTGQGPALAHGGILIHGVSLGEVALMRGLVPRLEVATGLRCVLCTTTETGRQGLDRHFPEHQRAFLPLDVPWAVNRFLSRARPRLVVLMENELWPVLLCACAARGIPVVLANARMSARSFARYRRTTAITRPLFTSLDLVLAQNGAYGARLARLGVGRERLSVCGSMKTDGVVLPEAAQVEHERLRLRLGPVAGSAILLLASTSQGEEERLLWACLPWSAGWQLILCPRHPERGAELAILCAALGRTAQRSSQAMAPQQPHAPAPVVIVDEIGHLGQLYALTAASGGIAVVGGSLGSGRGGQNMLEAAAAGCCTVVGWDVRNQPDAMQLLRAQQAVVELTESDLGAVLADLATDRARRAQLGAAAQRAWSQGRGAVAGVAAAISRRLPGRAARVSH